MHGTLVALLPRMCSLEGERHTANQHKSLCTVKDTGRERAGGHGQQQHFDEDIEAETYRAVEGVPGRRSVQCTEGMLEGVGEGHVIRGSKEGGCSLGGGKALSHTLAGQA